MKSGILEHKYFHGILEHKYFHSILLICLMMNHLPQLQGMINVEETLKTTRSGNPSHPRSIIQSSRLELDEPRSRRLQSYLRVAAIFRYCIFAGVSFYYSHT